MKTVSLIERWEQFDTEAFAKAVITGKGSKEVIQEAKDLMEETIAARDEE